MVDVSPSAYRALRIIEAAGQQNATLTLPQAADLIRGLQKGSFSTQEAKGKGKGSVDVVQVAGGKVEGLDKDGGEALIMKLLLDGYLEESFHASAFSDRFRARNLLMSADPQPPIALSRTSASQVEPSASLVFRQTKSTKRAYPPPSP